MAAPVDDSASHEDEVQQLRDEVVAWTQKYVKCAADAAIVESRLTERIAALRRQLRGLEHCVSGTKIAFLEAEVIRLWSEKCMLELRVVANEEDNKFCELQYLQQSEHRHLQDRLQASLSLSYVSQQIEKREAECFVRVEQVRMECGLLNARCSLDCAAQLDYRRLEHMEELERAKLQHRMETERLLRDTRRTLEQGQSDALRRVEMCKVNCAEQLEASNLIQSKLEQEVESRASQYSAMMTEYEEFKARCNWEIASSRLDFAHQLEYSMLERHEELAYCSVIQARDRAWYDSDNGRRVQQCTPDASRQTEVDRLRCAQQLDLCRLICAEEVGFAAVNALATKESSDLECSMKIKEVVLEFERFKAKCQSQSDFCKLEHSSHVQYQRLQHTEILEYNRLTETLHALQCSEYKAALEQRALEGREQAELCKLHYERELDSSRAEQLRLQQELEKCTSEYTTKLADVETELWQAKRQLEGEFAVTKVDAAHEMGYHELVHRAEQEYMDLVHAEEQARRDCESEARMQQCRAQASCEMEVCRLLCAQQVDHCALVRAEEADFVLMRSEAAKQQYTSNHAHTLKQMELEYEQSNARGVLEVELFQLECAYQVESCRLQELEFQERSYVRQSIERGLLTCEYEAALEQRALEGREQAQLCKLHYERELDSSHAEQLRLQQELEKCTSEYTTKLADVETELWQAKRQLEGEFAVTKVDAAHEMGYHELVHRAEQEYMDLVHAEEQARRDCESEARMQQCSAQASCEMEVCRLLCAQQVDHCALVRAEEADFVLMRSEAAKQQYTSNHAHTLKQMELEYEQSNARGVLEVDLFQLECAYQVESCRLQELEFQERSYVRQSIERGLLTFEYEAALEQRALEGREQAELCKLHYERELDSSHAEQLRRQQELEKCTSEYTTKLADVETELWQARRQLEGEFAVTKVDAAHEMGYHELVHRAEQEYMDLVHAEEQARRDCESEARMQQCRAQASCEMEVCRLLCAQQVDHCALVRAEEADFVLMRSEAAKQQYTSNHALTLKQMELEYEQSKARDVLECKWDCACQLLIRRFSQAFERGRLTLQQEAALEERDLLLQQILEKCTLEYTTKLADVETELWQARRQLEGEFAVTKVDAAHEMGYHELVHRAEQEYMDLVHAEEQARRDCESEARMQQCRAQASCEMEVCRLLCAQQVDHCALVRAEEADFVLMRSEAAKQQYTSNHALTLKQMELEYEQSKARDVLECKWDCACQLLIRRFSQAFERGRLTLQQEAALEERDLLLQQILEKCTLEYTTKLADVETGFSQAKRQLEGEFAVTKVDAAHEMGYHELVHRAEQEYMDLVHAEEQARRDCESEARVQQCSAQASCEMEVCRLLCAQQVDHCALVRAEEAEFGLIAYDVMTNLFAMNCEHDGRFWKLSELQCHEQAERRHMQHVEAKHFDDIHHAMDRSQWLLECEAGLEAFNDVERCLRTCRSNELKLQQDLEKGALEHEAKLAEVETVLEVLRTQFKRQIAESELNSAHQSGYCDIVHRAEQEYMDLVHAEEQARRDCESEARMQQCSAQASCEMEVCRLLCAQQVDHCALVRAEEADFVLMHSEAAKQQYTSNHAHTLKQMELEYEQSKARGVLEVELFQLECAYQVESCRLQELEFQERSYVRQSIERGLLTFEYEAALEQRALEGREQAELCKLHYERELDSSHAEQLRLQQELEKCTSEYTTKLADVETELWQAKRQLEGEFAVTKVDAAHEMGYHELVHRAEQEYMDLVHAEEQARRDCESEARVQQCSAQASCEMEVCRLLCAQQVDHCALVRAEEAEFGLIAYDVMTNLSAMNCEHDGRFWKLSELQCHEQAERRHMQHVEAKHFDDIHHAMDRSQWLLECEAGLEAFNDVERCLRTCRSNELKLQQDLEKGALEHEAKLAEVETVLELLRTQFKRQIAESELNSAHQSGYYDLVNQAEQEYMDLVHAEEQARRDCESEARMQQCSAQASCEMEVCRLLCAQQVDHCALVRAEEADFVLMRSEAAKQQYTSNHAHTLKQMELEYEQSKARGVLEVELFQLECAYQVESCRLQELEFQERSYVRQSIERGLLTCEYEAALEQRALEGREQAQLCKLHYERELDSSHAEQLRLQQELEKCTSEYMMKPADVETELWQARRQLEGVIAVTKVDAAHEMGYHELVHRAEQEYMDLVHAEEQARRDCESEARMQQCSAQASCEMEVCRLLCAQQVDHCALVRAEEADFVLMHSEAAKQRSTFEYTIKVQQAHFVSEMCQLQNVQQAEYRQLLHMEAQEHAHLGHAMEQAQLRLDCEAREVEAVQEMEDFLEASKSSRLKLQQDMDRRIMEYTYKLAAVETECERLRSQCAWEMPLSELYSAQEVGYHELVHRAEQEYMDLVHAEEQARRDCENEARMQQCSAQASCEMEVCRLLCAQQVDHCALVRAEEADFVLMHSEAAKQRSNFEYTIKVQQAHFVSEMYQLQNVQQAEYRQLLHMEAQEHAHLGHAMEQAQLRLDCEAREVEAVQEMEDFLEASKSSRLKLQQDMDRRIMEYTYKLAAVETECERLRSQCAWEMPLSELYSAQEVGYHELVHRAEQEYMDLVHAEEQARRDCENEARMQQCSAQASCEMEVCRLLCAQQVDHCALVRAEEADFVLMHSEAAKQRSNFEYTIKVQQAHFVSEMYQLQNVQQAEYRQLLHMEAQEHAHLGHAMEQAQLRLDCEAREVEAVQEMEDFLEASKSSRLKLQQDMDRRIMEYTYKLAAVETECERLRSQCAWEMPLSELYSAQGVGYHELVHRAEQEYMDLVHAEEQARRDCENEARMQQCSAQASCEMEVCRLLCAQQVDHCALVRAEEADFVLMHSEAAKQRSNFECTIKVQQAHFVSEMCQLQNVQQAEYRQLLHMEAQEHAHLGHAMEQAQLRLDCEAREVEAVQEMEDFLEASKSSRLKLQQDMDRRIMEYTYKLAAVETECERLRSQCAWEMPLSELYSAQEVGYHELVHRAEQEYMDLVHAEEQARRDCENEARVQQCSAQASCEMEVCRLLCAQQVDHCALVRAEEADFVLMRSEAAKQQYTSNHALTLKQMELEYEQSKARGVLEVGLFQLECAYQVESCRLGHVQEMEHRVLLHNLDHCLLQSESSMALHQISCQLELHKLVSAHTLAGSELRFQQLVERRASELSFVWAQKQLQLDEFKARARCESERYTLTVECEAQHHALEEMEELERRDLLSWCTETQKELRHSVSELCSAQRTEYRELCIAEQHDRHSLGYAKLLQRCALDHGAALHWGAMLGLLQVAQSESAAAGQLAVFRLHAGEERARCEVQYGERLEFYQMECADMVAAWRDENRELAADCSVLEGKLLAAAADIQALKHELGVAHAQGCELQRKREEKERELHELCHELQTVTLHVQQVNEALVDAVDRRRAAVGGRTERDVAAVEAAATNGDPIPDADPTPEPVASPAPAQGRSSRHTSCSDLDDAELRERAGASSPFSVLGPARALAEIRSGLARLDPAAKVEGLCAAYEQEVERLGHRVQYLEDALQEFLRRRSCEVFGVAWGFKPDA